MAASAGASGFGGTKTSETVHIALHYQNENCHPDGKVPYGTSAEAEIWRREMLAAAGRLQAGMRRAGIPIIHVQGVTQPGQGDMIPNCRIYRTLKERGAWPVGSWGADFIDGLKPVGDEIVVTHGRNNGFYGSRLEEYLARLRPRRLIMSGVSTAYVVESTVRHACDVGYDIIVASDACSTFRRDFHEASLRAMSMLAVVAETDDIVSATDAGGLDNMIETFWAREPEF